ncbi:MAG: hypothetical protein NTU56_12360, partial [Proteobacteria bacterium]|nr:hypothetical protein [Pseudomonadota bacterium]
MSRIRKQGIRLDTKSGRDELRKQFPTGAREPFWHKLSTGRYLGLRLNLRGESWIGRFRDEDGGQQYKALGELSPEFGFDPAKVAAELWFRDLERGVSGRTDDGDTATVKTACNRYVEDRERNASKANAHDAKKRFERTVNGKQIADLPLSKFRSRHLKEWRDGLVDGGLSRGSV